MKDHILLIEDEPWLGELYVTMLTRAGFQVTLYYDIYEAFTWLDSTKPQLIILDLLLPWSNGIQLLHELSSYSDLRDIPVVIYSNAIPKDLRLEQVRHYGVAALLHKVKNRPEQLIEVIRGVLHG